MSINKLISIVVSTAMSCVFCATFFISAARANHAPTHRVAKAAKNDNGLSPTVLKYAVNAYRWALKHNAVSNPTILTIVNFNQPSYQKRLWVIDLKSNRVLMHMYVAQGKNTGAVYATRFSNQHGSRESSPGIFTTQDVYNGEHGESLRVNGLEKGINNNALSRAVVIHPASYVTPSFIKQHGYAGKSWGCFAVNPAHADRLIRTVKGGTVLFAYAGPERHDPRVDHRLSAQGEKLYNALVERV